MKIYSITPLVEHYKQLVDTEPEHINKARFKELTFKGDPKTTYWRHMTLKWIMAADIDRPNKETYDKDHTIPDIAYWQTNCLVLSPKATSVLKPALHKEAEFLPVTVGREDWFVFNVINMQNVAKEIIKADWINTWLDTIIFDKTKISNAKVFRVTDKPTRIFTSDVQGSFKKIVEHNNLTGIEFDEY